MVVKNGQTNPISDFAKLLICSRNKISYSLFTHHPFKLVTRIIALFFTVDTHYLPYMILNKRISLFKELYVFDSYVINFSQIQCEPNRQFFGNPLPDKSY